jgi:hypothetical protein
VDAMLEVFKYALKFSDMTMADNWFAARVVGRARMVNSMGALRGIDIDEDLLDDELLDQPFFDLMYRFARGVGYSLQSVKTGTPNGYEFPRAARRVQVSLVSPLSGALRGEAEASGDEAIAREAQADRRGVFSGRIRPPSGALGC